MNFSLFLSAKKAFIQVVLLVVSAGLSGLVERIPAIDFTNPTVDNVIFVAIFFILNIIRNWLKQKTTFGRYL